MFLYIKGSIRWGKTHHLNNIDLKKQKTNISSAEEEEA